MQVIKTHAEHGQLITVDEPERISEFMYMFAEIVLDIAEEYLKKEKQSAPILMA